MQGENGLNQLYHRPSLSRYEFHSILVVGNPKVQEVRGSNIEAKNTSMLVDDYAIRSSIFGGPRWDSKQIRGSIMVIWSMIFGMLEVKC